MLSPCFAAEVRNSFLFPLTAEDVYTVIDEHPVKVIGFTINPLLSIALPLTVTVASADGSTIYHEIKFNSATGLSYSVCNQPFVADKGLAWKSSGNSIFFGLVGASFFLTREGT